MRKLTARVAAALLAASMLFGLAGCSDSTTSSSKAVSSSSVESVVESTPELTETPTTTPAPTETPEPTPAPVKVTLADIPAYSGEPFTVVNDNVPYFSDSELTTTSSENYSPLDTLGRCGVAYACVGLDTMPTAERESISTVKPSGWTTGEGLPYWQRCHLLGYQLTAENANDRNLITGTRYLNVEGMLPFENMVADYVKETGNHVLYRVTPMFDGNDLVARGVLMEAKSVEDDGDGVLYCVYCYNVCDDSSVTIDYATGNSTVSGNQGTTAAVTAPAEVAVAATPTPEPVVEQVPQGTTYILNTNTKKFHYPSCGSVKQMKESNKQSYTGSRDDVIAMGYVPCKKCNP